MTTYNLPEYFKTCLGAHTRNGLLLAKKVYIITIQYKSIIQKVFNSKEYLHPSFVESSTLRHDKFIIQMLVGQTMAPSVRLRFECTRYRSWSDSNGLGTYIRKKPAVAEQSIAPGFDRSHFEWHLFEFKEVHRYLLTRTKAKHKAIWHAPLVSRCQ